ncbi:histidine triad protein [Luminiphilus syltensis NOR5-1B]|uniref:Histidine triad protein n=1 Tax=Luminiphilus syltensis NOR5-1B TaxID=565045 RepID=B8KWQ8_9GAMM|nr:HIT domain-containing protein [Luminiphilus syltensis]EED35784.1 histidine triad protein [Luminiphilus syltensis NOR5-1B]
MLSKTFNVDGRLSGDTEFIIDWPLCQVLLMNDARFPWLILVPRIEDAREPFDLSESEQTHLWRESMVLGRWMSETFTGDKLNIGMLGNIVAQLHVHHVARSVGDSAWPGPVWGSGTAQPYTPTALAEKVALCQRGLAPELIFSGSTR